MKTGFWKYLKYCDKLDRAFDRVSKRGVKNPSQVSRQYDDLNDTAKRLYWSR